jgi:hypothetical protein
VQLVAGTHYLGLRGSDSYLVTTADHLQRLGHEVTLYSRELDERLSVVLRDRGLSLAAREDRLPADCDGVLVQDAETALVLADRYPGVPQVFVMHGLTDLETPPLLPGVTTVVVALNDRFRKRAEALAGTCSIVRLRQPIDIHAFYPRGDPRPRAEDLVAVGNRLQGARRSMLVEVCAELGIGFKQVGELAEPSVAPELEMARADIVVGYGRSLLEGMASGRPAYVWDHAGGDGWVTPDSYEAMEADGFSGGATPHVTDRAALRRGLAEYRPDMGLVNYELVRLNHSAMKHAEELVALFVRHAGADLAPATPLREMSRLIRLVDGGRRRRERTAEASKLMADSRRLHERLAKAENRAAKAEQRLSELRSRRVYRLGRMIEGVTRRLRGRRAGPGRGGASSDITA